MNTKFIDKSTSEPSDKDDVDDEIEGGIKDKTEDIETTHTQKPLGRRKGRTTSMYKSHHDIN